MKDFNCEVFAVIFFVWAKVCMTIEINVQGLLLPCNEKSMTNENEMFISPFHAIENCNRKIRLTLNITNSGKTQEGLDFVYLRSVADAATGIKMNLLNPLVLQLSQKQVILAYPFKYLSAVNGKASEIIINYENRKNFTGCDDTSPINPTCGIKHEKGASVPYSEGFCCFCPESPVKQKQIRGGQDCSLDVGDTADIEKQKFKASAHCLHFNDIWYTVSALSEPIILHDIYLQVYNQRHLTNGSSIWIALTHDVDFELGTKKPYESDENKTIIVAFFTSNPKNTSISIDNNEKRLFIPQPMPAVDVDKLPDAVKKGATDYLLIPKSIINPDGKVCDTAGVSYEAFAKQEDRCNVVKDTCLKNQPLDFWASDDELRKAGKKGSYMLQNFGVPYKEPIIIDQETKEHWLALEYYEKHLTVLTIELNADKIVPLTVGRRAQISKVITASFTKKIDIHISILNAGLTPAKFSVQANHCGFGVPDSNNESLTIAPQLMEDITISTKPGEIELDTKFTCLVEVRSEIYGIVAKREVLIKPLERCICNMHCQCACLGESLTCHPLEERDFHAAGFRGSLPILTAKPPFTSWFREHPFLSTFSIILILLLIGLIKAVLGLAGFSAVAKYEMKPCIYQHKKIKRYIEPELKNFEVIVYDDEGYPINPDTKERAKVIGDDVLFILNIFFCCIWPYLKVRDWLARKLKKTGYDFVSTDDTPSFREDDDEDFVGNAQQLLRRSLQATPYEADTESEAGTSLHSVDLHSDPGDLLQPIKRQSQAPKRLSGTVSEAQPSQVDKSDVEQSSRLRLRSTISDSILETTTEGLPDLQSKEAARWQKGTHKITTFL